MYASLEDLHSLSLFSINCSGGGLPEAGEDRRSNAVLYGNGRHQVEVIIRMRAFDKERNPLKFEPSEFFSRIYLCDFETGDTLQYAAHDDVDVFYSDARTEYCNVVTGSQTDRSHDDLNVIRFYVSMNGVHSAFRIACRFVLSWDDDNFVDTYIDTTGNHTSQLLPNGSPYEEISFISVRSQHPIDYGDSRNLAIPGAWFTAEDFTLIADRMYLYRETGNHTRNGDYWQISEWAGCHIRPAEQSCRFISKEIERYEQEIAGEKVSGVTMAGPSGREADFMQISGGVCDMISSSPRKGGEGFQASFIFVDREEYGVLSGSIYYEVASGTRNETIYTIEDTDGKHHWKTPVAPDSIRVDFCNHVADDNRALTRWAWDNVNTGPDEGVKIRVIDNYGNQGTIHLTMGPWPKLRINGAVWR